MQPIDIATYEDKCSQSTYSIEAEDLMVERIFYHLLGNQVDNPGFYVDLGACDPIRASNTYRFYKRGWYGINVEVNPQVIPQFLAVRPRDITLNVAVGEDGKTGQYMLFNEPLLNGFLPQDIIDHHVASGYQVVSSFRVPFMSVNRILSENVPQGVAVDFLNIDIETMEHAILSEWDFSRWTPQVIAVEIHGPYDILSIAQTPVAMLLVDQGYTFVSRMWHTSIFALVDNNKLRG